MADRLKWQYDARPSVNRYRDLTTGRFLPRATLVALRDRVTDAAGATARALAASAANGEISGGAFELGMRQAIRNAHTANFVLGRGGMNSMTPKDWATLGRNLQIQYDYLARFRAAIEAGTVSPKQAAARAAMYVNGSTRAFETGQAAAWGIDEALPLYPGDNCDGLSNCRCSWVLRTVGITTECTWTLGGNDPCQPCQDNARAYNPFVIEGGVAGSPQGTTGRADTSAQAAAPDAPLSRAELDRALAFQEQRYRTAAVEHSIVIDPATGKIVSTKEGLAGEVSFTDAEVAAMKGNILTHNHPAGWTYDPDDPRRVGNSFSQADVRFMALADLAEMRAVTPRYVYAIERPAAGWPSDGEIARAWAEADAQVRADAWSAIRAGTLTIPDAEARHFALVNQRVADRLGWNYTVRDDPHPNYGKVS